jgi:hypothetical protein
MVPGPAETGIIGVVPVESEPRMAGPVLLPLDFCVASLAAGAAVVLLLVFAAALFSALPAGLGAGFALVLVSLLVAVPAVLFFVLSAVLFDLAPDLVSALAALSLLVSALVPVVAPGRELGSGDPALVLVDVCAAARVASAPQVNAPLARMPQATSRTVNRVSRTLPPAANA